MNRRRRDFQSLALPTELPRPGLLGCHARKPSGDLADRLVSPVHDALLLWWAILPGFNQTVWWRSQDSNLEIFACRLCSIEDPPEGDLRVRELVGLDL